MVKAGAKDAAKLMTLADAGAIAAGINRDMHNEPQSLARFCLLLRWLALTATDDERETLYIETEAISAAFIDGVGEAILEQMGRELDALRRGAARKGGRR
jgi:hypothetical protein